MARNLNTGLGIDFQPGFQEGLISNRGADMLHEIGIACAKCRTSDPHANMLDDGKLQTRSPNCSACHGDGWKFRSPLVVRGLAVNIRSQKNIHDVGIAQPGDMNFSVGAGFFECSQGGRRVARNDKFTATWDEPLDDGQTIVRGAASLEDNVRLSNNVNEDEDRLWYEPSTSLWCEDENGVEYSQNADFELGPGKVIKWVGRKPAKRVKYTLKYTVFFEWLVFAKPQERRDRANRDLGPLVMLRRRHIAFVNDSPHITEDDRVPLSTRVEC